MASLTVHDNTCIYVRCTYIYIYVRDVAKRHETIVEGHKLYTCAYTYIRKYDVHEWEGEGMDQMEVVVGGSKSGCVVAVCVV